MPTDDERRRVSGRLRAYLDTPAPWHLADVVSDALGDDGDYDKIQHLADLIEPGEPKVRYVAEIKVDSERLEELVHDAVVELTGIDRDALLKLAYMLQAMGERSDEKGRYDLGITFTSIADRIREALGESDG